MIAIMQRSNKFLAARFADRRWLSASSSSSSNNNTTSSGITLLLNTTPASRLDRHATTLPITAHLRLFPNTFPNRRYSVTSTRPQTAATAAAAITPPPSSSPPPPPLVDLASSPDSNVPPHIADRVLSPNPKLYQTPPHPLHTIKQRIEDFFPDFTAKDSLSPIVSTQANFDSLLIPPDHVSRTKSDTYYVDAHTCLRTHTSAHQVELLRQGYSQFLCTGDVYRRDDIDKSHYPIFHQMEGVKLFDASASQDEILQDLRDNLEGLAQHLFGPVECRWVDEYFPFTHPSLELEIMYQGDWLEVLGCGVMQPQILQDAGLGDKKGWAFGLGLERLAMVLFGIPDIRLFWSQDDRFWNQFAQGEITTFTPYSKYPPCYKDVSFWIDDQEAFHVNEVLDLTRQIAGDLVEEVALVDQFAHPKTQRESHCYRVTYRSMDRSLTNSEIDVLQDDLRAAIANKLPVELR
jgi:phenylalanyl-tRNA synthetase alpha chain